MVIIRSLIISGSLFALLNIAAAQPDPGVPQAEKPAASFAETTQAQANIAAEQRRIDDLEAELAQKPFDPKWSRAATGQIFNALDHTTADLGPDGLQVKVVSVNCGARLCRVELASSDPSIVPIYYAGFMGRLGWSGEPDTQKQTDSGNVFYVFRLDREASPQEAGRP